MTRSHAREGRALLRALRRRAGAATHDGRADPGLPAAHLHHATSSTTTSASAVRACSTTSASARGPASGTIDVEGYHELVDSWVAVLRRRRAPPARPAAAPDGRRAAAEQHYEAAAQARDGLDALERAASEQNVVLDDHSNLDVVAVATDGGRAAVVRFRVRHGRVIGRTVHLVDRSMDESEAEILETVAPRALPEPASGSRRSCVERRRRRRPWSREFLAGRRGRPVEVVDAAARPAPPGPRARGRRRDRGDRP